MKTLLKISIPVIVFILLVKMCSGDSSELLSSNGTPASASHVAEQFRMKHGLDPETMRAILEDNRLYLAEIIDKFSLTGNEFTGEQWYVHKLDDRNKANRTGLLVSVKANGEFVFSSNYHGSDWLFHESISVRIDDRLINSSAVPFNDDNNVKDNRDGYVWETVTYTKDDDRNIFHAVGSNPEKTIRVRFNGKDKKKDITLSEKEKEIIADYSFLSQLLTSIHTKEAALREL